MPSLMHARAGAPRELRDEALDLMLGALSVDDPESVDAAPTELQKLRRQHEDGAYQNTLAGDPTLRTPCASGAGALVRLDTYTLAAVACDDALAHRDVLTAVSALYGAAAPQNPMTLEWLSNHPASWHGALWAVHNLDQGLDEREDWVLDTETSSNGIYWCCKQIDQVASESVDARLSKFCSILYSLWWQLKVSKSPHPSEEILTDVLNRAASTIAQLPTATRTMMRDSMRAAAARFSAVDEQDVPNGPLKQLLA